MLTMTPEQILAALPSMETHSIETHVALEQLEVLGDPLDMQIELQVTDYDEEGSRSRIVTAREILESLRQGTHVTSPEYSYIKRVLIGSELPRYQVEQQHDRLLAELAKLNVPRELLSRIRADDSEVGQGMYTVGDRWGYDAPTTHEIGVLENLERLHTLCDTLVNAAKALEERRGQIEELIGAYSSEDEPENEE